MSLFIHGCRVRLQKYRQIIDKEKTKCCEFMGKDSTKLLRQRVLERAREKQTIHEAALENKCRKLQNATSSRNDILVHNLESKELRKGQIQVLQHEASFNTTDAKPANTIAALESVINQTEAT
ncbi:unnamed protein product [Dibothriocephalus latus]|uniref:Uncharacterized protein n=1 Tax=Dibothriocephalus latus TaxID=60516 RepID=A0A3P7PH94_DIBLA|nr:unnamed protein product [Dibothriocephalus latus]